MFSIANILTGFNLLSGIVSILVTFQGRLDLAVLFLAIAMILDFLDGFVARLMGTQGEIGKQLDSLADMVSFGVAPGCIVFVLFIISAGVDITGSLATTLLDYSMSSSIKGLIDLYFSHLLSEPNLGDAFIFHGWHLMLPFVAFFIPFLSLFRLAKFNLDTRQTTNFLGLPTPAHTLFYMGIALTLWFGFSSEGIGAKLAEVLIREQVLMSLTVLFSFMLIVEIPLIALKFKNYNFTENWEKYSLLFLSLILIITLKTYALTFIVLLYLILSIVKNSSTKKKNNEIQS